MWQLFQFPLCPFSRKVRLLLGEKGVGYTLIRENPWERRDEFIDMTPAGQTPVMTDETRDIKLIDSLVICEYLDELAGNKLMPASGLARWKVRTEHSLLQGMLDAMLLCRYERLLRPRERFWDVWDADQWDRAWQGFALFNARPEILERPLDLTQIALTCALAYADFRFPDQDWRGAFPKLAAFNEMMMQRPSVNTTLPPKA